ncbi:Ankyrin-2 [Dactylellina cionopaga]|nr:Ankyrin-2 [Dactylellina cionopaga]
MRGGLEFGDPGLSHDQLEDFDPSGGFGYGDFNHGDSHYSEMFMPETSADQSFHSPGDSSGSSIYVNGHEPDSREVKEQLVLIEAIKSGDEKLALEATQEYIKSHPESESEYWKFYSQKSFLHYAAEFGSPEIAQLLLENGLDINQSAEEKSPNPRYSKIIFTPLAIAVENERMEMVKFLISKGADLEGTDCDKDHHEKKKTEIMPIEAAVGGSEEMLRLFIREFNFPLDKILRDGSTMLYIAIKEGDEKAVEILLQNGADPDAEFKCNERLLRPLEFASTYGMEEISRLLLKHNADPNRIGRYGTVVYADL